MKNWRTVETEICDHIRRRGGRIVDVCGRPFIGAEFFDDCDGRLLEQRLLVDVEALSRAIEDNT